MRRLPILLMLLAATAAAADLTVTGGRVFTVADGGRSFLTARAETGPTSRPVVEGLQMRLDPPPARVTGEVSWGRDAFLCRLAPGPNSSVVQLSIGRVRSRLAASLFSPSRDDGVTFYGENVRLAPREPGVWRLTADRLDRVQVEHDVYKVGRGLKWFTPYPSKQTFRRAAAGWCSWYYYYQGITEDEVLKNTDWLARNFRQFGCYWVQIDDGWQGTGHGGGDNRDWFVTCRNQFPHGMEWLAGRIRSEGFSPGIWLCSFGQSDEKLFTDHPELFVRRADGTSVGEEGGNINWVGHYLVDPTGYAGKQYLHRLFDMLCNRWGYDYVKIDGQGGMAGLFEQYRAQLADTAMHGDEAYRAGIEAIRDVMGYDKYLLCCGGGWDAIGLFDGCRTGGDVGPSWEGMQPAIDCTMRWLFTNNIAWYTDPDCVLVREPLTLDQARLWATLVGITGQMTMASDRMYALPDERLELLRRIFPVADIRPMDLYPFRGRPGVFDIKVHRDWGDWDVVGLFNWSPTTSESVRLTPADIGLPEGRYVYYDAWGKHLLGLGDGPLAVNLAPTSCTVVVVRPLEDRPQLVGTSRHLTQGAEDLHHVRWYPGNDSIRGRSDVVAGDPYELRFTLPPGWTTFGRDVRVEGPLGVLTLRSPENARLTWQIKFHHRPGPQQAPTPPPAARFSVRDRTATLSWSPSAGAIAYRVYRNDELIGVTAGEQLVDTPRGANETVRYVISSTDWAGHESARVPVGEFALAPVQDAWLADLEPISASQGWGTLRRNTSVEGKPMTIAGRVYERGLGTHADAELVYDASGYRLFEAEVGVDGEKGGAGTCVFQVWVDGEKRYDSGRMTGHDAERKVSVLLDHNRELRLVVTNAGDDINCDHADWADARLYAAR